jgi:pyridoxal/pyridoxine/pyridoxamine kinase
MLYLFPLLQYVPTELRDIYRDEILPLADVITPNAFELG